MASRYPSEFLLQVVFEAREDGGLRARCDKLPNFLLSHSNADLVRADVVPALETLLSEMYGVAMKVRYVPTFDEVMHKQPCLAPYICAEQNYLSHIIPA